ncbi:hypothetical protein [Paenibacillus caui]|uniref:hypothetical protein n=1 Tax=Paenibacillus caui TaxID=2873927 RepID=UPI001CA9778D|nr:hypothetical protein [Paenibacillus caui]
MNPSWLLNKNPSGGDQVPEDLSFIGGIPRLPADVPLPSCALCGEPLTFFFQIAFPDGHAWGSRSIALFACTCCADERYLIPEMLEGELAGADIPEGFLTAYQRNFRILPFPTQDGTLRGEYKPKIRFERLLVSPAPSPDAPGNKLGGSPNWLLDDEAPATYASAVPMEFLMQLTDPPRFDLEDEAPPQIRIGLRGKPEPSPHRYYELFIGNRLYFFGTKAGAEPLVYILTQV